MLRRLPIESAQPLVIFAVARLAVALAALGALIVLGFPYDGRAIAVVGGLGLPWTLGLLFTARRNPEAVLHPLIAAGDIVVLVTIELVVPEAYGATRFTALFVLAAHAHFQGERRGLAIALGGSLALVAATVVRGDAPLDGDPLAFYEVVFVLSAAAAGAVVGSLRTAESASRLRARSLSRRTIKAESEVRRRVAEAIHDGPVQELIGLDMILASARKAAADGRREEAAALLDDARELAERNIRALRDEIVDLGPYAFEELGFDVAIENCIPVWKRRYRFEVMATIERIELPPEMAGALFRIAQEAVVNAGRHAGADTVSISLRTVNSDVELRVTDNGHGFEDADPLGSSEPGHLGLASMRERAELLDGRLEIESSELGTRVLVRAPLPQPAL
ncbi:MAG TPA: ATP-binding protein [Thermoleophilaceae bacterium]|nr:ATP-binding protein [Thermoleophilaceae bacterium]